MLKLFVVDDEKIIREGILNCLNWQDYGISILGDARNGAEALEVLKITKPDILLTDVRMPIMDGIEMSRQLRKLYPNIKIIFISGYADLEYLRTAFKVDAEDYILKPVDIDELEKVIRKVANLCKTEKYMKDYRMMLEQKLLQSMPFLREKFMKLLVSGEVKDRSEISERFKFLDIHIPLDTFYSVFMLSVDSCGENFDTGSQFDRQLMSFSIINVVQETMDNHGGGYVFEWGENEFVCVIGLPTDETLIEDCIDALSADIHKNLNEGLKISNTLGIGLWVETIEKLHVSFKYARNSVNQKFLKGLNKIIYVDRLYDERQNQSYDDFVIEFINSIREHDSNRALTVIDNMFDEIKRGKTTDIKYVQCVSLQIVSAMSSSDLKSGLGIVEASEQLLRKITVDEMHQYLKEYINNIFNSLAEFNEQETGNVVYTIKNIIHTRYGENLSISSLAGEVYLTPAYICMLFKQDTGMTINEYLTAVRIEKAKELLRKGSYKMFEIATFVGYSDHKYFSKLFKKHTGVNPSEFK